jgi:SulP family sulfate permease
MSKVAGSTFRELGGPAGLGREVSAGLVGALSALTNCFAYGALIFSGPLHPFVAQGIAASLITCCTTALVYTLMSRFATAISAPSAATSALLAALIISLGPVMATLPPTRVLAFAYTALFAATAATAIALLLLGFLRAGKFVRFIPYPVIAGFMGATAWLMIVGAIRMSTDVPMEMHALAKFGQPREGHLVVMLFAWTAVLWIITKRIKHPLTLPVALIIVSVAADLLFRAFGVSHQMALAQGFLFSVSNTGWPGVPLLNGTYFQVDWRLLLPGAGSIGALVIIAVLQTLFIATGLEMSDKVEADLDQESRAMGWGNALSALLGGYVGQVVMSATTVTRAAGGTTRITVVIIALVALVSVFGAARAIDFIPRFVLGGVLLLQGLRLLQDWAIASYKTVPRLEWLLIVVIIVMTAWFGYVPAEIAGLLAACVLFVLNVSRVEIIRSITSLDARASSLVRPEAEVQTLAAHGAEVKIFDLRGYMFFGSAHHLRERVKTLVSEQNAIMVIFDFSRVAGMDSSTAATMLGIARGLKDKAIQQVVVGLAPASAQTLKDSGALPKDVVILDDIDAALELGENAVLARHASEIVATPAFSDWLTQTLGSAEFAATLQQHLVKAHYKSGSYLCRRGDPTDDLYFIEQGRVSVTLERDDSTAKRLRVFGPHTFVGEIAFVLGVPRTASLRIDEDAVIWSLDRRAFGELMSSQPKLVITLLQDVVRLQAERLAFATRQIAALQG